MTSSLDTPNAPNLQPEGQCRSEDGEAAPLPPPGTRRRVDLHRRRALISAARIDVRPSRLAIIPPLFGFLVGLGCVALIVWGVTADAVPYWLLAILLLLALIAVPLSGISVVYAVAGANVIFDQKKQSGAWQQGFLGMGIGTTELVPFWKIEAILVTEAGFSSAGAGGRVEELAQWEVHVLKQSGKRLLVGGVIVPRSVTEAGLTPVMELARAVAALTGATLRFEAPTPLEPAEAEDDLPRPAGPSDNGTGRRLRRRSEPGARKLPGTGPLPHARRRRERP